MCTVPPREAIENCGMDYEEMRSSVTSTSLTPRKEKSNFIKYFGGSSDVFRTILPTAALTAAWNRTLPTWIPSRFTRTDCPG